MVLRLTCDLFALFVQRYDNISTDSERRAGLSPMAELITRKQAVVSTCRLTPAAAAAAHVRAHHITRH